jgi:hypothetical protein
MEKLYSRVFYISERIMFLKMRKRRIRARSKKFMIKEIDGLQYLYTKDANLRIKILSLSFYSIGNYTLGHLGHGEIILWGILYLNGD